MNAVPALLFRWLGGERGVDRDAAGRALASDYGRGARHDWPEFLRPWVGDDGRRADRPRRDPAGRALASDYGRGARHDWPEFLRPWVGDDQRRADRPRGNPAAARQARHGA